ncbi:hypothetical protein CCUS01_11238 [Colletotrichum cuscutae]|uniref:BTB domain-containing protein n=1 Tax=Colletotrichum cuscutae TaxID=1209917 RepID=A0AAI9XKA0_9PEZI|nr:hypothetical protein CCUS01_11238 [Colletotrichum cuscutae]
MAAQRHQRKRRTTPLWVPNPRLIASPNSEPASAMTAPLRTAPTDSIFKQRDPMELSHTLDPDGDVVLVLDTANPLFALWDQCTIAGLQELNLCQPDSPTHLETRFRGGHARRTPVLWNSVSALNAKPKEEEGSMKLSKKDKKKKKKQKEYKSPAIATISGLGVNELPSAEDELSRSLDAADSPVVNNGSEHPQTPDAETHPPTSSYDQTQVQSPVSTVSCVEFIVSSRHLSLSSHYFRAQLCGPWAEALVHSQDGRRHIRAHGWDADALLLLMQIFHAKTRDVPRFISLEQLAKIAILVDYYSCYNAVRFFSVLWIDALKEQLPSQCNRELVLWLFVAVVFRRDDIFQTITKTAVTESKGPLPTLGLPIPGTLIDQIDFRRQDAIAGILETLDTLGTSLLRGLTGCDFGCSSALFGALAKEMAKHKLMDPEPCAPFLGYGITALEKAIKDFQTPRWGHSVYHASSSGPCQLVSICTKLLEEGLNEVKKGFTLSEVGLFRP